MVGLLPSIKGWMDACGSDRARADTDIVADCAAVAVWLQMKGKRSEGRDWPGVHMQYHLRQLSSRGRPDHGDNTKRCTATSAVSKPAAGHFVQLLAHNQATYSQVVNTADMLHI